MKKQNIFSIIHITIYLIYASCIVYFVTVRNFRSIIVSILSLIGIIILIILGIFLECEYMKDIQQGILNIAKK